VLGFWRNFRNWDDNDLVIATAARTAFAVDESNYKMRLQTRSFYRSYFSMIGDAKGSNALLPELVNVYPRDEVSALDAYMRPAEEFGYIKRKQERERLAREQKVESLRSEVEVARESASTDDLRRIKTEIDDLIKVTETPLERVARRARERELNVDALLKERAANSAPLNTHLDDEALWNEFDLQLADIAESRLSDEEIYQEAQRLSEERLKRIADTDVQMARRNESSNVLNAMEVVTGYRRVVHPELSESGVCGICIVASSRIYSKSEMEPIHYFCKCETLPITLAHDPGETLNREALDKLYTEAGGMNIDFLSNTRYQVDEHGELGLVAVLGKMKGKTEFTNDAPHTRVKANRKNEFFHQQRDAGELGILYSSTERLKRRFNNGETQLQAPLQWEENRIQQLETKMKAADVRQVRAGTFKFKSAAKSDSGARKSTVQLHELAGLIANRDVSSELAVLEKNLPILEEANANGTNRASAIKYHRERIEKLKKLLGR
jgi:hypothetical protein